MLHDLPAQTANMLRPKRFTFPYHYTPHPLCVAAAEEVRRHLKTQPALYEAAQEGKMFGVLIVAKEKAESLRNSNLAFLAAYSGELAGDNKWPWFVPPVYDLLHPSSYFQEEEANIVELTHRIKAPGADIPALKLERKSRSQALQQWLFKQYRFLNGKGEECDLMEVFEDYYTTHYPVNPDAKKSNASTPKLPPSGSGECCAPKLLQAAYIQGLIPVAMAEFWVGRPPKDELRIDGHYYPACSGKCRPILSFMLQGLDVEDNPLLQRNRAVAQQMKVLFADASIAVIDKPSGMLAAPGKDPDEPNVLTEVRRIFPAAEGPVIVHRLDMDTSGLMVVALTSAAYHDLQRQFLEHRTQKRYTALLDGNSITVPQGTGTIDLPLCPNPYDRPRQMVSQEYGKRAITRWQHRDGRYYHLWPETGRTHQLRVHCAHPDGLACPINGDALYGNGVQSPASHGTLPRLCLHADSLTFTHPSTGETLSFQSPCPF